MGHNPLTMNSAEIRDLLRQTLADQRVSRGERHALREVLEEAGLDAFKRSLVRNEAFDLAAEDVTDPGVKTVLKWLKDIINVVEARSERRRSVAECHFSPGEDCRNRLERLVRGAKKSVDVCVFTITDNFLARALVDVHQRGVVVRVITDDDKAEDRGSDAFDLERAGIPVALDHDPSHMHHKFAIFDRRLLASGSYNWTRSAFSENRENVLVTDDRRLVGGFCDEFEDLWKKFS